MKIETEKTVPETIQGLIGNKGIFHIEWLKKDKKKYLENYKLNPNYDKHTILRKGNFRLGVVKNLVGKKRTTKPSDYMIAQEMKKDGGYRNIYYNTIQKIVANKKTYYIKTIDTKRFRFCLVEQIEKGEIN